MSSGQSSSVRRFLKWGAAEAGPVNGNEPRVKAPRRRFGEARLQPGTRPTMKIKDRLALRHAVLAESEPPPVGQVYLPVFGGHPETSLAETGARNDGRVRF